MRFNTLLKKIIILLVKGYQKVFSGPSGVFVALGLKHGRTCVFEPTCSAYTIEAIKTHSILKGLCLALWRILRCHPWQKHHNDPVPQKKQR